VGPVCADRLRPVREWVGKATSEAG